MKKKYVSPEYDKFLFSPYDIVSFSMGEVEEECEKYYDPDDCKEDIF